MSFLSRIKNIWELSAEKEEKQIIKDEFELKEISPEIPKKEAVFIPRITRDPIKAITEENNDH